jgi:hypothetical protein
MVALVHQVNVTARTTCPLLSRRAFQRALPHRLGGVEVILDTQERRVEKIDSRLTAMEPRADNAVLTAQNIEGIIELVQIALGIQKRRERRRPAVAR